MPDDGRDMLIRLMGPDGPFPGECRADVAGGDPLAFDFVKHFYSDVQTFTFAVGLEERDKKQPATPDKMKFQVDVPGPPGKPSTPQTVEATPKVKSPSGQFGAFQAGQRSSYPADLQPFSFTKLFDVASISIFDACARSRTLPSVALVKRKAVGKNNLYAYLRFAFTDVLITDLDWEEDDVIKETVHFICRKVRVQYYPEMNDGTLDKTLPYQEWSMRNTADQG